MLSLNSLSGRRVFYRRVIEKTLRAMERGRLRVRVPRSRELYRRRSRSQFHTAPEIFLQTGGATDFECPADHFRLGTGQVCVMPRGVPHAETPVDLRTPYSVLVCTYRRDGVVVIRGQSPGEKQIISVSADHVDSGRARDAFHYLDEIAVCHTVSHLHRRSYREGLLNAFLVTLLDELDGSTDEPPPGSPKVAEAEKLARANLPNTELSVAMLAASLSCSADYLSRLFHEERKVTLNRWISSERVAMARELLLDPRYNISEVGWACGFSSTSYFIRVFREHSGLTPRTFRLNETRAT